MPLQRLQPQTGKKLLRIVTVPISLKHLIKGQAAYFAGLGYQVVLVSADGPELDAVRHNESVPHIVIPFSRKITPLRDLYCLYLLVRLFLREKPDIIHTQTPKAGLLGMIAGWICRVPKRIHTVGGLPIMTAKGLRRLILRFTETITNVCAHQVLANSHKMAAYMVDTKLCSRRKLYVLGKGSSNGIDTLHFQAESIAASSEELRLQAGIPTNGFVFLFVGRLVKDKGVREIVAAFEQLARVHPDIWLLLVGPTEEHLDPLPAETWEAIRQHPRIKALGYHSDVRPFFKMSNLLLFPSYREGFPNVPLQAGAMKLPAIVSNINGCNEIVQDGVNGWLVEAGDTSGLQERMEDLLQHPLSLKAAASKTRDIVMQHYSQTQIWQQLADMYSRKETVSLFYKPHLRPITGGLFHAGEDQSKVS